MTDWLSSTKILPNEFNNFVDVFETDDSILNVAITSQHDIVELVMRAHTMMVVIGCFSRSGMGICLARERVVNLRLVFGAF